MKGMTSGAAVLAAMMAVAPLHLQAQRGPRMGREPAAGPRGAGVEMILRQREQLQLTESQVNQLDQIREQAVQRRNAHQDEMTELRSKVMAGEMKPEELRQAMQARRDSAAAIATQQRERVEAVLTDAQKQKVDEWRAQARGFRMGRMSAMRGGRPGMMGRRGFRGGFPGMRGRGFAPGMGQGWGPDGMGFRRGGPGGGQGNGPAGGS
jgi:Spy/CpxP family protein refolding chaperone